MTSISASAAGHHNATTRSRLVDRTPLYYARLYLRTGTRYADAALLRQHTAAYHIRGMRGHACNLPPLAFLHNCLKPPISSYVRAISSHNLAYISTT